MRFSSLLVLLLAAPTLSQAGVEKVGTTSAAFLKLGSGARPAAMGEAYVGVADDASGIAYNPAGMAQSLMGEVQATHTEWFRGLRYENLNAVLSLGDGGMLGGTFNFLAVPQITRTEQIASILDPSLNFRETGAFQPFDLQAAVAYARPVYRNVLAGANFKLLSQSIDDRSTFGIGLDVGAIYRTPIQGLTAGFAAENLGTPIKLKREAFDLPLLLRLGAGYRVMDEKLLLALETDVPTDNALVFAMGLEYAVADMFYPRFGWRFNSIFNPWSAGLGMKFDHWGMDLSVVPFGELGLTYRGSVNWRFGKPGANLEATVAYASTVGTGKSAVLTTGLSAPDKVAAWGIYIYDSGRPAKVVRSEQGSGPVDREWLWNGRNQAGQAAPEGVYWAVISARYATGQTVYSKYVKLEVNNSVPVVDLALDPISANPKAQGEAFIPTAFKTGLKSGRGIALWRLEILDMRGMVFRTQQGQGDLPEGIVWDGKDDHGEALVSGQVYSARLWVKDAIGNESVTQTPVSFRAVFR
jgi:flagellar hook assembly protein FlgD